MGNFSRDTFDRLKHYVGVRLQQGVPLVDADWNEQEDIRKDELRSFLRWFIGDGVPLYNDGFCIIPAISGGAPRVLPVTIADNDFAIRGGEGTTEGVGRCLVDGWDVINENQINYTEQWLYNSSSRAAAWGVDPLLPLTKPALDRTDTVHLDVWEREVNATTNPPTGDPTLINQAIGIETCVRLKREWVVRVAEGSSVAPKPDPSKPTQKGHLYYPLATLKRAAKDPKVRNFQDLRRTGLAILPYTDVQQVLTDAYGPGYTLDHDGQPNLRVSLREAINALLRGGLPSLPEQPVAGDGTEYLQELRTFLDRVGDIWLVWSGAHQAQSMNLWSRRYVQASGNWEPEVQLTTSKEGDYNPSIIQDAQGGIWLFWSSSRPATGGGTSLWWKRREPGTGLWSQDTQLTTPGGNNSDWSTNSVVDRIGDIWVFWMRYEQHDNVSESHVWSKRYTQSSGTWGNESRMTTLGTADAPVHNYSPDTAQDSAGRLWLVWYSFRGQKQNGNMVYTPGIFVRSCDTTTGTWSNEQQIVWGSTSSGDWFNFPKLLLDAGGGLRLFWFGTLNGKSGLWYLTYNQQYGYWQSEIQVVFQPMNEFAVASDSSGDLWLIWFGPGAGGGSNHLWAKRYSVIAGWGREIQLSPDEYVYLFSLSVLQDPSGDICVFWIVNPQNTLRALMLKRLISVI